MITNKYPRLRIHAANSGGVRGKIEAGIIRRILSARAVILRISLGSDGPVSELNDPWLAYDRPITYRLPLFTGRLFVVPADLSCLSIAFSPFAGNNALLSSDHRHSQKENQ